MLDQSVDIQSHKIQHYEYSQSEKPPSVNAFNIDNGFIYISVYVSTFWPSFIRSSMKYINNWINYIKLIYTW
jgi:hypothetical protein